MKQYKALKPIGRWVVGDVIGDLPNHQINQLLEDGFIQELKPDTKSSVKKPSVGDSSNV